jgi:hypothetical protein
MTDAQAELLQRALDERRDAPRIEFSFDLGGIQLIVEDLRTALLNPHRLSGNSADATRTVIEFMIDRVEKQGFPANAELLRGTVVRGRLR